MKNVVLTAKHHDGFCLFDTRLTDFKSTNAPCRGDLVREFLEAFRSEGAGSIRTLIPMLTPAISLFRSDSAGRYPGRGGNPIPWETCITLNNYWGYAAHDHHYKSAKMVIRMLVECVSKGGNLLLTVKEKLWKKHGQRYWLVIFFQRCSVFIAINHPDTMRL